MADPRFYTQPEPVAVSDIVAVTGAALVQGSATALVHDVGPVANLQIGILGYALTLKNLPDTSLPGGVIMCVKKVAEAIVDWPVIVLVHEYPQRQYALFSKNFIRPRKPVDTAVPVSASAHIGKNTSIAWNATISEDAVIGDNVRIGPGASIGPGVSIGADSTIHGGVQIIFAEIGERVKILPNAVIGGAGFGMAMGSGQPVDIPQFGYVSIGDDVTIGACSSIDRATFGATRIGDRCKLDNQVQIGHNVEMGNDCVLAAFVGISGSCKIGNQVMFGGRVCLKDHVRVGDGAIILLGAAVFHDVPSGERWAGYPAKPSKQAFREFHTLGKLAQTGNRGKQK